MIYIYGAYDTDSHSWYGGFYHTYDKAYNVVRRQNKHERGTSYGNWKVRKARLYA